MTCRELVSFLADYRSGELEPAVRAHFEAHLRECPKCIEYLRSYEESIELARRSVARGDAPEIDLPADLVAGIVAASRAARPRRPRRAKS